MNWKITWIFIVMVFGISCSRNSCPLGGGAVSSEMRDLPAFQEIVLYDKINVILKQDTVQNIEVEAAAGLLSGISTTVHGGTLIIQDNNGCKSLRTGTDIVNIYVSTGNLQKITYHGAGNVSSIDTIRAAIFTVDSFDGSGSINLNLVADTANAIIRAANADISFNGHSNYTYVYSEGEGSVQLFQFTTLAALVESKSIRDIDVHVTGNLSANILYKGNVYYMGNPPQIQTQISSSGKLIYVP
jgi:hypothetical protein